MHFLHCNLHTSSFVYFCVTHEQTIIKNCDEISMPLLLNLQLTLLFRLWMIKIISFSSTFWRVAKYTKLNLGKCILHWAITMETFPFNEILKQKLMQFNTTAQQKQSHLHECYRFLLNCFRWPYGHYGGCIWNVVKLQCVMLTDVYNIYV